MQPNDNDEKQAPVLIPLVQFYLSTLAAVFQADKLTCILQDLGNEKTGRLYLVRDETTVPEAVLNFDFQDKSVLFGLETRSEQKLLESVKYAEGLDAFLPKLQQTLNAGRLAAPKVNKPKVARVA